MRSLRQEQFTSMARIQQYNWHYYYRSRRLSLKDEQQVALRKLSQWHPPNFTRAFTINSFKSSSNDAHPFQVQINFGTSYWKYNFRSESSIFNIRYFTTKGSEQTNTKPGSINDIKSIVESETAPDHTPDSLGDIKLKVESVKDPKNVHGSIQKTQDDFADYLSGGDVTLDEDTGLIVKKQSSQSLDIKSVYPNISGSNGQPTIPVAAAADEKSTEANENENTDPNKPTPNMNYQYIFTPKDATLSGRDRYESRRRAMEQKLQEQQNQSRAATYSNVQRALGGNAIIAVAKLAAAISSGSSAMMSEFVHSVVDCGNQALLLVGLNSSTMAPDRTHPYGYGKAIYFWALVSALGTFFLGAGVSMTHAVGEFLNPQMSTEVPLEVWGVLGMSFVVDGYVFTKTIQEILASKRIDGKNKDMSFWAYATTKVRDPATLAVLLEDGAACLGVIIAIGGIGMTQYTGVAACDAVAGMGISALLGAMGLALCKVNHRFLIGQGLEKATRMDIERIILSRRSIDNIYSVQSQWTGPDTFSYKAEVDAFDYCDFVVDCYVNVILLFMQVII